MAGLVQTLVFAVQTGRWQHANRACQHGGFVGQNIAEHVARDHHVEFLGLFDQLHGGVVDVHVIECHVGVLFVNVSDHVFPELEGLKHIGLVNTGHFFAALAGGLKGHMGNAFNFGA